MQPTLKQIQQWATKHMTKRVKDKGQVIECIEGCEDVEFHLAKQGETSFKLVSVEPLSDFMRTAPLNLS